jgi:hypothetical protein
MMGVNGSSSSHNCRGMGMPSPCSHSSHGGGSSSSSYSYSPPRSYTPPAPKLPNPDPSNYEWVQEKSFSGPGGDYLVVELHYPDCTNFEGNKILVYKGFVNFRHIEKANKKLIDPHFCDSADHVNPIARFIPDKMGWLYATSFAETFAHMKG